MFLYAVLWAALLLLVSWASDRLWQLRDVLPPQLVLASFAILAFSILLFLSIEPDEEK